MLLSSTLGSKLWQYGNHILFQKIACCLPLTGALAGKSGHCTFIRPFWSFSTRGLGLVKRLNSYQRGKTNHSEKGHRPHLFLSPV